MLHLRRALCDTRASWKAKIYQISSASLNFGSLVTGRRAPSILLEIGAKMQGGQGKKVMIYVFCFVPADSVYCTLIYLGSRVRGLDLQSIACA